MARLGKLWQKVYVVLDNLFIALILLPFNRNANKIRAMILEIFIPKIWLYGQLYLQILLFIQNERMRTLNYMLSEAI